MSNDRQTTHQPPRVTIVVSPRERFSLAQRSLDSIYATADVAFDLVYVDARSPKRTSDWLKTQASEKGFKLIHLDRYVTPNEARNLGLAAAETEYVAFTDNDVIYAERWLSTLIRCADETGADVVAPLVCEDLPLHSRVHQARGYFAKDKAAFFSTPSGEREIVDVMVHFGAPVENVRDQLQRAETDVTEFHCVLARRSLFDRIGPLDEDMYATKEHFDFCMSVLQSGGKIIFEPNSVVTHVQPSAIPLSWGDLSYFLLRWSPEWQLHSLDHMQKKWGIKNSGLFNRVRQPDYLRGRHYEGFVRPLIRKTPIVRQSWRLTQTARKLLTRYFDRKARHLAEEYERQRAAAHHRTTAAE